MKLSLKYIQKRVTLSNININTKKASENYLLMILRDFFYIIILPSIMLKSAHVLKFSLLHHPHRDYHRNHTNDNPYDHNNSQNS